MKDKRLNDEPTIVGLILLVFFITYYLISGSIRESKLEKRLIEAETHIVTIEELERRLAKAEDKLDNTSNHITSLQNQIEEYKRIDSIVKDIATSWYGKKD
jgi:CII-binding regulator of phage lambda lysogenization HflD